MGWLSPTSHHEEGVCWDGETNAYDENTATKAISTIGGNSWGCWLDLNRAALTCDKIHFWITRSHSDIDEMEVEIHKNGAWVNLYQGMPLLNQWVEKSFAEGSVDGMRIRFHNDNPWLPLEAYLHEADFWEVPPVVPPAKPLINKPLINPKLINVPIIR